MEILDQVNSTSLFVSLALVVLYFALQQIAVRMGDDVYSLFKRALRWIFGRKRPAGEGALATTEDAPAEPMQSVAAGSRSRSGVAPERPVPQAVPDDDGQPPMLTTGKGDYYRFQFLAEGEIAKLYRADFRERANGQRRPVVLKIARMPADGPRMQNEAVTLRELQRDPGAHGKHLPEVVEQFRTAEGNAGTVLEALDGLTITELCARFSDRAIPPRHALWIFRRGLSILGYAHSRGILHGNLRPEHLLVRAQDHNVWLLDWTCAAVRPAETGQGFLAADPVYGPPEAHRGQPPIPPSDLYSLGKVMVYAFGGDPERETIPKAVPEPLERFTRFFLKPSAVQRPQDAWEMYHALEKIRDDLYGPHRFVEFEAPEG